MRRITRRRTIDTVDRLLTAAQDIRLIRNTAGSGNGERIIVDGVEYTNFGSCSYLALERHPRLLEGTRAALDAYGTQFSFSRAYLDSPLYAELEETLSAMTGRAVLVTPSTTLAHLAALPVLIDDADTVLIDQFAHASLHTALQTLQGTPVERLRHNRMDLLEERLVARAGSGAKVWFVADGIYSMLGDRCDLDALDDLLTRYPQLHVYLDDAHATSCYGGAGRGLALDRLGHHDRVVVALSLNKAFAAAGGALALPSAALRERIRRCGGPMVFAGPVQPPMLGAGLASARLHLDPGFGQLQAELHERVRLAGAAIEEHGLRTVAQDSTPIFMVAFESTASLHRVLFGLRDRGFYCCLSSFPAVPIDKPSLRFTVSRHNTPASIAAFVGELAALVATTPAGAAPARSA